MDPLIKSRQGLLSTDFDPVRGNSNIFDISALFPFIAPIVVLLIS